MGRSQWHKKTTAASVPLFQIYFEYSHFQSSSSFACLGLILRNRIGRPLGDYKKPLLLMVLCSPAVGDFSYGLPLNYLPFKVLNHSKRIQTSVRVLV